MLFAFLTGSEMLFVFLAIVILFGATRIPQLGEALGKGIHNFRNALNGKEDSPAALESGQKEAQRTKTDEEKNTL